VKDLPHGPPKIIDADAHILEPADVFTSRLPKRFAEDAPRVERSPRTGISHWRIGSNWIWPVGHFGQAGFHEYPPINPSEYEDVQTSTYDADERLKRMDEYGVDVQVLYPNIVGFQAPLLVEVGHEFALACTQAYNDFAFEWSSADPARLIPMVMLPYWDRDASVAEMVRCMGRGAKGVLFANKFERIGLPGFTDPYWDPVYSTAQEMDVPVNYHVGFSSYEASETLSEDAIASKRVDAERERPLRALWSCSLLTQQADLIGQLLISDICERFPTLNLVSVETGFGHLPFYLECLDWHWKALGNKQRELLPSEYFARQIHGTFWFERRTLALLSEYPDNFLFTTDYPHSTGGSPGPCSPGVPASQYVSEAFERTDPDVAYKAVWGNASRLYGIS
jgi:predicted TIM-barrel fold metal-dependent hydrolase